MRDSLKTNLCLPSAFITHHSALNAMSLFRIRTQSHGAIPTHTYHFEDNKRNLDGDRLCTRCTTNTLGCETHAILECTYSKQLVSPLINKLRSLLSKAGQPPLDSLPTSQQISIILGNPPSSLPTKPWGFTKSGPKPHWTKSYPTFLPSKHSFTHDHLQKTHPTPLMEKKEIKHTFVPYLHPVCTPSSVSVFFFPQSIIHSDLPEH